MTESDSECIFCKIVRGEIKSEILKSSSNFIAIKDINPVSEGHTLVVPKAHYVTLLDIPEELGAELLKFTKEVASGLMERKMGPGFNVIMNNFLSAGQFVPHAHLHVIPRKEEDGIRYLVKE